MNKLLASIVEAHGGLDRWRGFNRAQATIVTGGAFWGMKSLTQVGCRQVALLGSGWPRQLSTARAETRRHRLKFGR